MTYLEKLRARIHATGSALCVGLDVRSASADEARVFLREVIAQTAPHAAAFKPNAAYFEALGWQGMKLLEELRPMIPAEESDTAWKSTSKLPSSRRPKRMGLVAVI